VSTTVVTVTLEPAATVNDKGLVEREGAGYFTFML
jgi:hypothetical protein